MREPSSVSSSVIFDLTLAVRAASSRFSLAFSAPTAIVSPICAPAARAFSRVVSACAPVVPTGRVCAVCSVVALGVFTPPQRYPMKNAAAATTTIRTSTNRRRALTICASHVRRKHRTCQGSGQTERDPFGFVRLIAHGDDDVLLTLMKVGNRRARGSCRKVGSPQRGAGQLVQRLEAASAPARRNFLRHAGRQTRAVVRHRRRS